MLLVTTGLVIAGSPPAIAAVSLDRPAPSLDQAKAPEGASQLPALGAGESWYYIHLFLDARPVPFDFDAGCVRDGTDTITIGTFQTLCGGTYSEATTTPPFNRGWGTTHASEDRFAGGNLEGTIQFFVPGATLSGSFARSSLGYPHTVSVGNIRGEGPVNGEYVHFRLEDTGMPRGEKGGPMVLGMVETDHGPFDFDNYWGLTFDLRGWVITSSAPVGTPAPVDTEDEVPPAGSEPDATTTTVAAAPEPVAVQPRFTG